MAYLHETLQSPAGDLVQHHAQHQGHIDYRGRAPILPTRLSPPRVIAVSVEVILVVPTHGDTPDVCDTNVLDVEQAVHDQRVNRSPTDYGDCDIAVEELGSNETEGFANCTQLGKGAGMLGQLVQLAIARQKSEGGREGGRELTDKLEYLAQDLNWKPIKPGDGIRWRGRIHHDGFRREEGEIREGGAAWRRGGRGGGEGDGEVWIEVEHVCWGEEEEA